MWPITRVVSICLTGAFLAAPSSAQVQKSIPEMTARIEGPQVPNRQGYDPYTIAQIMKMANVPGLRGGL